MDGLNLECYWVGSLDFNFLANQVFLLNPKKEGSTATKKRESKRTSIVGTSYSVTCVAFRLIAGFSCEKAPQIVTSCFWGTPCLLFFKETQKESQTPVWGVLVFSDSPAHQESFLGDPEIFGARCLDWNEGVPPPK